MEGKEVLFNIFRRVGSKRIGFFFPQTYALGLPDSIKTESISPEKASLITKDFDNQIKIAGETLTFLHEVNHLSSCLGSAFGLGALFTLSETVRYMVQRQYPISLDIDRLLDHMELFYNAQNFTFYFQTELGNIDESIYEKEPDESNTLGYTIISYPAMPQWIHEYSPLYLLTEKLSFLKKIGLKTQENVWLNKSVGNHKEISTKVNAAMLFEGLAILTELNTLGQYVGEETLEQNLDTLLNELTDLYGGVFHIYKNYPSLKAEDLIINLSAIIDIALMQDPYALYDNPPFLKRDSEPYQPPVNFFFRALDAASRIGSFSDCFDVTNLSNDSFLTDIQGYQNAICNVMGIPTTIVQTEKAIRKLLDLAPKNTFEWDGNSLQDVKISESVYKTTGTVDLRIPFILHYKGLLIRMNCPGFFLLNNSNSFLPTIYNSIKQEIVEVSAESRNIKNLSIKTLSLLVAPAITSLFNPEQNSMCPFQVGRPFFCSSKFNTKSFCFRPHQENSGHKLQICPFYLFGRKFEIQPGGKEIIELINSLNWD